MNERNINLALLILRISIGSMFILHGWPKLQGGPDGWYRLGLNMQYLGITFLPTFWGFMAMASEFFGGMLLIAGIAVRPAAALMFITMLVAAISNLCKGYGLEGIVEIIETGGALFALLIAGGGGYSIVFGKICSGQPEQQ